MKTKVTRVFSWPLMKQSLRSNLALTLAVTAIFCMMSIVITYAGNLIGANSDTTDYTDAQTDFYSYLYVCASYNEMAGTDLSYEDFCKTDDTSDYEMAFSMISEQTGEEYTTEKFAEAGEILEGSDVGTDAYIEQFEYVYALGSVQGCFTGNDLDVETMMDSMLNMMGIDSELIESMGDMDTSAMLNQMYYTMMGILPMLLFIIVVGNALVVNQVDRGSMAYILSTPTKRNAVSITQMIYMIFVPLAIMAVVFGVRCAAVQRFCGEVDVVQLLALYGGMYLLVEAMAGICYFASCCFNQSKFGWAVGGGLNIWFFLASLLGMFGSEDMTTMGMGVEELSVFNHLTLVGLFDYKALGTVGSGDVDTSFVWKLCVLAAIAVVLYVLGIIRFRRKDLPL